MNRRDFLLGAGVLLAAPSIVRASSLMPVSTEAYPRDLAIVWGEAVDARGFAVGSIWFRPEGVYVKGRDGCWRSSRHCRQEMTKAGWIWLG